MAHMHEEDNRMRVIAGLSQCLNGQFWFEKASPFDRELDLAIFERR